MDDEITEAALSDALGVSMPVIKSWGRDGLPHICVAGRSLFRLAEVVGWLRHRLAAQIEELPGPLRGQLWPLGSIPADPSTREGPEIRAVS